MSTGIRVLLLLIIECGLARELFAQLKEQGLQRLQESTVRVVCGGDQSSGVIVSDVGHILTVAHGLHGDSREIYVYRHDGSRYLAERLLIERDADIAILKISVSLASGQELPFVPVAADLNSLDLRNAMVVATGYPARVPEVVHSLPRLGEIRSMEGGVIRTTCMLTVGDSGGALMHQNGQLIGIHRKIGLGIEANVHLSMTRIRDTIQKRPELWQIFVARAGTPILSGSEGGLAKSSMDAVSSRTVIVVQKADGAETSGLAIPGVRLDARRVVTKLSELSQGIPITCRLANGREAPARVLREESVSDLIFLELNAGAGLPEVASLEMATPIVGDLVYAVTGQGDDGAVRISGLGVLGRVNYDEPAVPAKLGAILEEDLGSGFSGFREVSPNGPAAAALIEAGDVLLGIDGRELRQLEEIGGVLRARQPGDFLRLDIRRKESRLVCGLRLGHDPAEQFEKREYLDGRVGAVSFRRTGFRGVCQHDIPLQPLECGGMLLNSRGQWIGINIARRSRESTLAISADQLVRGAR